MQMLTPDYINWLRGVEMEQVLPLLDQGSRILEVGAGTGEQARRLTEAGHTVAAIDLASSNYAEARVFEVRDYDGRTFPFPDASFDVVFSSNTLEHVRDLERLHKEIRRVLKPGGRCIHILPTGSWQFWSILAAFPAAAAELASARSLKGVLGGLRRTARAFLPPRHGERGFALLEIWLFRPQWWRNNFRRNGFEVVRDLPLGLFYTGAAFHDFGWSRERREQLARRLGSSTHLFELKTAE